MARLAVTRRKITPALDLTSRIRCDCLASRRTGIVAGWSESLERANGRIEVIAGGMFSGKSEELVRRLRRAAIARQRVQVFKPGSDNRHDPCLLVTRDNRELEAVS